MKKDKIKIVCFEDNPGDVYLIKNYLDETPSLEYDFVSFERLDKGIAFLQNNKPDIIILDLGLPDSSGIDTFLTVQKMFPDLTIIVLTGNIDSNVGLEAVQQGAQDYLIKNEISQNLLSRSILYAIERKKITSELKAAKQKAEMADKLKTTFLANMSHDLRTPMNSIIGFSELLKECSSSDQHKEYINIIVKNGEILLNLLNDIIDISKIESGQLNINKRSFDLRNLFNDLNLNYQKKLSSLKKPDVKLILEASDVKQQEIIFSDQSRIYQVMGNLLDNAMKFTSKGEIVFGYKSGVEEILFFVKDTGIGIPKKSREEIFDRFGQVQDALNYNLGGTGLGLTIAKNLVELMGGKIWLKSEVDEGSNFFFTIPYEKQKGEITVVKRRATNDKVTVNWEDKTFLIVEDIESNRQMLETALRKTGVTLIIAKTGEKAVEICKSNQHIDLVLMDIRLPGINGCEATKEILKLRKNLPVIAQTALAIENKEKECYKAGAKAYLSKPIRPKELLNKINSVLKKTK